MRAVYKKILPVCICLVAVGHSGISLAQQGSASLVPNSGAFLGLGFSAGSTQFNDQQIEATGISQVMPGNTTGTAGGPPVGVGMSAVNSFAPVIQGGYFQKFQDSSYLWGAKFSYSYMGGATATTDRILIPQYGTYPNGSAFTGNAVASSYQKTINNQISLIPFIGQSFERSMFYVGAGLTISQVSTKINNLIGFADLNGARTDVSGTPQNFSDNQWVLGGVAMIGGSYFIDPSLFLDFTYTYSVTQNKTSSYYSTFNNPGTPFSYSGQLIGSSTGTATNQAVTLTINKIF